MTLKLIYTFFIGIFLAVFIGVGISAFYPEPKFPEQPAIFAYQTPDIEKDKTQSAEYIAQSKEFDKAVKQYQYNSQLYSRNVSIITLLASILIVITSLALSQKIILIPDGLLLGGVLTLVYSVIRGFGTEDNKFRFFVVSIGLFISLFLGYWKFIKIAK